MRSVRLGDAVSRKPDPIGVCAAVLMGLGMSSARPFGMALSIAMPALVTLQPTRRHCYTAAAAYYGTALWPLIPGAENFFGPDGATLPGAILLWIASVGLLAAPWALAWSEDQSSIPFRAGLALAGTVIPPLGIIGWASPLIAAGILFPGFGIAGLLLCFALPAVAVRWPRPTIAVAALAITAAHLSANARATLRAVGWQGIDMRFGDVGSSPIKQFEAATEIQQIARASTADVIVFPETVVPAWTTATDLFWQPTIESLRQRGTTILVGARIPLPTPMKHRTPEYAAAIELLKSGSAHRAQITARSAGDAYDYDNAVIIRGASSAELQQAVPVPIGMWNPFKEATAHMHLFQSRTLRIHHERAAVLICYEQIIPWPMILAAFEKPTVLVAIANDHWARGTPIPEFQRACVRSWAALLHIPFVLATNQ